MTQFYGAHINRDAFLAYKELDLSPLQSSDRSTHAFEYVDGKVSATANTFLTMTKPEEWEDSKIGESFRSIVNTLKKNSNSSAHLQLSSVMKHPNFQELGDKLSGMKLLGGVFDQLATEPVKNIDIFADNSLAIPTQHIQRLFDAYLNERTKVLDALSTLAVPANSIDPTEDDRLIIPFRDGKDFGATDSIQPFTSRANTYNADMLEMKFKAGKIESAAEFLKPLVADDFKNLQIATTAISIATLSGDKELLAKTRNGIANHSLESMKAIPLLRKSDQHTIANHLSEVIITLSSAKTSNLIGEDMAGKFKGQAQRSIDAFNDSELRENITQSLHTELYKAHNYLTKEDGLEVTRAFQESIPDIDLHFPSSEFAKSHKDFKDRLSYVLENPSTSPEEDKIMRKNPTQTMRMG